MTNLETYLAEVKARANEQWIDAVKVADDLKRLLAIIEVLRDGLECNRTFHSLGGIDDCEPCKALRKADKIAGEK